MMRRIILGEPRERNPFQEMTDPNDPGLDASRPGGPFCAAVHAELLHCDLAGRCSGCSWLDRPYPEQLEAKAAHLRTLWEAHGLDLAALAGLELRTVAPAGLRDRVDLVLHRDAAGAAVLGLYDRDRREILTLEACPQMSGPLRAWYDDFRADPPPVTRGSLRLRVAPDGTRGVWLDFANADVKALLDSSLQDSLEDGSWLRRLAARAVVEIGQRRKRLREKEGPGSPLGLGPPEPRNWLPTFLDGRPTPVYSAVGAFTQVGVSANRALVAALVELLPDGGGNWVELGAGSGNFTLPLAAGGRNVTAVEIDELALEGLLRSAAEADLASRIAPLRASFHPTAPEVEAALRGADGILADPPRSGLGRLLERLSAIPVEERPRHFVYASCFAESFVADAAGLAGLGYRLQRLLGVDQFPQTPHAEFLARFERI